MSESKAFDWRSFLLRWSEEWADSLPEDEVLGEDEQGARQARWLGLPPAPEERIAAMEERLGRRMPSSYREFLSVSDGWRHAGGFVWLLAGTRDASWHEDASGLGASFEEYLEEDAGPEERREVEIWRRGLQLDVTSDATYVLMDPEDADEDGEWAVYTWASWRAAPPERHANFREFMREMHREFHRLRSRDGEGEPAFANDTTRELDARVEEARLEALRGGWERALAALDEAREYGRPSATGLGDQIRRLLGQSHSVDFEDLVTDPRYAGELLPPLVAEHAAHARDDSTLRFHLRGADEALVARAHATLDQVRNGTYRYAPAGPFGEAVERARELARWGEGDEAWRTLRNALPLWEPLGPHHLAPLGWVGDPLLGPLLTPERGRELLSTPRAGQAGAAPDETPDLDPPGLAWLAEPDRGGDRTSYRFVLVEGVEPRELPGRLAREKGNDGEDAPGNAGRDANRAEPAEPGTGGPNRAGDPNEAGAGAELSAPLTAWEARRGSLLGRREFSSYDDRALMAVGRAGGRWSFAFDGDPAPFDGRRFVSPAPGAGAGTRAVVVWCGLRARHGKPFFHLSVAREGAEEYAFTFADGEVRRSGEIPEALYPDRFFGDGDGGAEAERPLLEALAAEFGARLPRHAIVNGRLHTLTTRSWTRPPGEGEGYMTIWTDANVPRNGGDGWRVGRRPS